MPVRLAGRATAGRCRGAALINNRAALESFELNANTTGDNPFDGLAGKCAEAMAAAKELFSATMVEQIDMSLDDHDRLIAYVLGLSHALNIAFFTALAESGEAAPKLAQMSSTTFDAQLLVSAAVAQDNPRMYFEIQSLNKFGLEPLDALCEASTRIRDVVARGDEDGFVELMKKGQEYIATRG